jgi:hypothetical protein
VGLSTVRWGQSLRGSGGWPKTLRPDDEPARCWPHEGKWIAGNQRQHFGLGRVEHSDVIRPDDSGRNDPVPILSALRGSPGSEVPGMSPAARSRSRALTSSTTMVERATRGVARRPIAEPSDKRWAFTSPADGVASAAFARSARENSRPLAALGSLGTHADCRPVAQGPYAHQHQRPFDNP